MSKADVGGPFSDVAPKREAQWSHKPDRRSIRFPCAAVQNVLRTMAPNLDGISVLVGGAEDQDVAVYAEKTLLEQVVVNVVANALDAMGDTGDVKVRSLLFRVETDAARAELSVTDNGSGLATGQETEIFEPFETTKTAGGGLGLGLTVAQDAVTRFGGQIAAENNPTGPGATIRIFLPLA